MIVITLILLGVFLLSFRWLAPQPAWTSAAAIPCIMLAGLFAMNFFEPIAQVIAQSVGLLAVFRYDADPICFVLLFAGALAVLAKIVSLTPNPIPLPAQFDFQVSLVLSGMASYLVMAILLTVCDTSPRAQRMFGLRPGSAAFMGILSPDAHWLNLVGFVADGSFSRPAALGTSGSEQPRTLRSRFVEQSTAVIAPQSPAGSVTDSTAG